MRSYALVWTAVIAASPTPGEVQPGLDEREETDGSMVHRLSRNPLRASDFSLLLRSIKILPS